MAPAASSGVPPRPRGIIWFMAAMRAPCTPTFTWRPCTSIVPASPSVSGLVSRVWMYPKATQFTVTA